MSNPYLSQIERGLRKPSAEVLQQLASALRVSTPVMYLRAGLLDLKDGQGVLAAIANDPDLTEVAEADADPDLRDVPSRERTRRRRPSAAGRDSDVAPAQPPDERVRHAITAANRRRANDRGANKGGGNDDAYEDGAVENRAG